MTNLPEKRRHKRVHVRLEGQLKSEGLHQIQGLCQNVSAKGLYFLAEKKLPAGSVCEIVIHVGDSRYHPSIRVSGKVVRTDEKGMGIEFEGIDFKTFENLRNIIVYSSEDPDLAEEEFKKYLGLKRLP